MNFMGERRDVLTLAHELGHAVHQTLASEKGTLLADTPLTLAETASIFGEGLVFEKLLNTHHCVHIHPNNIGGSVMIDGIEIPVLAEFTFLRKDSSPVTGFASSFPHPLDSDNTALPSLPLPACWHGKP